MSGRQVGGPECAGSEGDGQQSDRHQRVIGDADVVSSRVIANKLGEQQDTACLWMHSFLTLGYMAIVWGDIYTNTPRFLDISLFILCLSSFPSPSFFLPSSSHLYHIDYISSRLFPSHQPFPKKKPFPKKIFILFIYLLDLSNSVCCQGIQTVCRKHGYYYQKCPSQSTSLIPLRRCIRITRCFHPPYITTRDGSNVYY